MNRRIVLMVAVLFALLGAAPARAAVPDLETLTVAKAESLMASGQLTSVELTKAYVARIGALNQAGPSLNAVRALNPHALDEAARLDFERAHGVVRGPLEGIPVIVKDNIDVAGMPTTAGNVALWSNIPAQDAPIVANMRAAGAVILGKANLAEFAFFLSNTPPNGYGGVEGQVINAADAAVNGGGSSTGSAAAVVSGMALVTLGSDTGGSIIQPSAVQGAVGLRPTMGLLSRRGIVPISASQDTAGPITGSVADAAAVLQATAANDPLDSPAGYFGSGIDSDYIVLRPPFVPNYLGALDANALAGKRIGVIASTDPNYLAAVQVLQHQGATTVTIPIPSAAAVPSVLSYEFKRDINAYLSSVAAQPGAVAPIKTLQDIIAFNTAHAQDVIKYGQASLTGSQALDISEASAATATYKTNLIQGKVNTRGAIDGALTTSNLDSFMLPAQQITGTNSRGGYVQLTIPAGYSPVTRRPVNVSFHGGAFSEAKILGIGYAYEQATKSFTPVVNGVPMALAKRPASQVNPSLYRCGLGTSPYPCPPGPELGTNGPALGFPLETATASDLEVRIRAKTLSSVELTKAYLARIANVNQGGVALNAVRAINPQALNEAAAADRDTAAGTFRGPLHGLPVLVNDTLDVLGMPTTGGAAALSRSMPSSDAAVVAALKRAGAVILGKANVTELGGALSTDMPQAYSSISGLVLNPYDSQVNSGGTSAGTGSAIAAGLAAAAIDPESGTGGLVTPAATVSLVGLRPTLGLLSRDGELPVGLSQDTPGPMAKTVRDAASTLASLTGTDYPLSAGALAGKKLGVIASTDPNYLGAVAAAVAAGATTVTVTAPAAVTTPSVLPFEFKRDFNAYLAGLPANAPIHSLAELIAWNSAHPDDALKYNQGAAVASQALDLSDTSAYTANLAAGRAAAQSGLDGVLSGVDAVLTPSATLTALAARAGYPQLTVPAGYNDLNPASQNRNPVGVALVGPAGSDAALLSYGYALEQALPAAQSRRPPSATNVTVWHCTAGNAYTPTTLTAAMCPPSATSALNLQTPVAGAVGGSVPATLALSAGAAASFGAFTPGRAADYLADLAVTVTSTAGSASLAVADLGASPGRLVNGAFALTTPLRTAAGAVSGTPLSLHSYSGPVTSDPLTIRFTQSIAAAEPLRTGAYAKTLTLTLATTEP